MSVFGQIQIRLEIGICVTTILGFQIELWLYLGTSGLKIASTMNLKSNPNLPKFATHIKKS